MVGIVAVSNLCGKQASKYSNTTHSQLVNSSRIANETLGIGLKTVHVFNKQKQENTRYFASVSKLRDIALKETAWGSGMFGFNTAAGNLELFYMISHATPLVIEGSLSVGDLTSFSL